MQTYGSSMQHTKKAINYKYTVTVIILHIQLETHIQYNITYGIASRMDVTINEYKTGGV